MLAQAATGNTCIACLLSKQQVSLAWSVYAHMLQIEEKVAKEGWSVAPSDTMTVVTLPEKCAWHAVGHCAVLNFCRCGCAKGS